MASISRRARLDPDALRYQGLARYTGNQLAGEGGLLGAGLVQVAERELHGALAHLVVGQGNCGQGRPDLRGDEPLVVKTGDGHVPRDQPPGLLEVVIGAHGEAVGTAEQQAEVRVPAEEDTRGLVSIDRVDPPESRLKDVGVDTWLPGLFQ